MTSLFYFPFILKPIIIWLLSGFSYDIPLSKITNDGTVALFQLALFDCYSAQCH